MDPITHALVGGMVAKTAKTSRRRFWIMMVLGEIPDIDVIFERFGSWAFWLQHRGVTHSLLGIVVQTFFFAWILRRYDPGSFRQRAWHYSLPLCLHVFCDYLTSYGVPLLSPFSFHEFTADLIPAVTVFPLLFMAVGLVYLNRKKLEGWTATHPLWTAWAVYLIFSLSGRAYAEHLLSQQNVNAKVISGRINPFDWNAVVQKPFCTYDAYSIDLLLRQSRYGATLETHMSDFPIQASLQSADAKRFIESNRWPVARVHPVADGWEVDWGRVIFSSRGVVRGQVRVYVAKDGTIKGDERIYSFWDPVEKKS